MISKLIKLLLLVSSLSSVSAEPFSMGLLVGGGVALSAMWAQKDRVMCQFYECCGKPWLRQNLTELQMSLDSHVFGQHLVHSLVTRSLKAHLRKKEPKKALVMSFHGWTGAGKNYVSKFIADSLYKDGLKSKFVHLFISTLHFPHEEESDIYKLRIQDWIRGNVSLCENTLFIFDEIDKMPEGMIDGIKPFIDHHESVEGVNFRKSIFLFLSNTGGREITRKTYKFWEEGKKREEIEYKDLEELVNVGAFNELGGLHKSSVIEKSLIDVYVPFLPLERVHIKMCIEREVTARNRTLTHQQIQDIADDLVYWPAETGLYSTTGCKRVAPKVDLKLEELEGDFEDI